MYISAVCIYMTTLNQQKTEQAHVYQCDIITKKSKIIHKLKYSIVSYSYMYEMTLIQLRSSFHKSESS